MIARVVIALLVLVNCATQVQCESVAIGLSGKNIFVQEYWKDGLPRYLIANLRKDTVRIIVHRKVASKESEKPLAGPWEVENNSVLDVDASRLRGKGLLRFQTECGISLGILDQPSAPPSIAKDAIATTCGLNGVGLDSVLFEQDKLIARSGEIVELKCVLPAGSGVLRFGKQREPLAIEGIYPAVLSQELISEALVIEGRCSTLAVNITEREISVDTQMRDKSLKYHIVTLRFRAPKVGAKTMVEISGYLKGPHRSGWLSRGIIIEPVETRPHLTAKELESLWEEFATKDDTVGYRLTWLLVAGGKQTVLFFKEQLYPVRPVDHRRLSGLINDLDSDHFATRAKAAKELEGFGELAELAMRDALKREPSPEVQGSLKSLLAKVEALPQTPDRIRVGRAIEVLEYIHSPEAVEFLEKLAKGAPDASLTKNAQAALERCLKKKAEKR